MSEYIFRSAQTIAPDEYWLECVNMGAVLPRTQLIKYIRSDIVDKLREQLLDARLKNMELEEKL